MGDNEAQSEDDEIRFSDPLLPYVVSCFVP